MSNHLRIVYNNSADRSTISASTTAGVLVATNMLTDRKSDTWRSTGGTATITMTFASAEFVGCVATPFCNLTSAATFRVRTYTEVADSVPVVDTGVISACAATPLGLWEWGNIPLGVNAYSYGGANYGRAWFATNPVKKVVIDIDDNTNLAGYIEISRMVAGAYFIPERNAELDANWEVLEASKSERNDATDLITDIGGKSKKITFNLQHMSPADRNSVTNILKGNGVAKPMFISLYPDDDDSSVEQLYQVWGKLSQQSAVGIAYWNTYNTTITIEEM